MQRIHDDRTVIQELHIDLRIIGTKLFRVLLKIDQFLVILENIFIVMLLY